MQLFKFIQADLLSFRQKPSSGLSAGPSSAFDPIPTTEPLYPKSLYLIHPLFSAYELNPVAPQAQASVPVPEGLDLDAWIVPPLPPPRELEPTFDLIKKKVSSKKGKKGKEKEVNGKKGNSKGKSKAPVGSYGDALLSERRDVLVPSQEETAEEKAAREKVSFCHSLGLVGAHTDAYMLHSARPNA